MPTERLNDGFIYRIGNATYLNFTPKVKDLADDKPGLRMPGLSALSAPIHLQGRITAFAIDVAKLGPTLGVYADDPRANGRPGHVTIVPIDPSGMPVASELEGWAASCGADPPHGYTRIVFLAHLEERVRCRS